MRHRGDDELVHKEVNRASAESRPLTLQKDNWRSESPGTTFSKSELVRRNESEICIVRRRGCGGISVGSACESAARDLRPRILRAVLSGRQLPEHRTRQPLYRWRLPGGQVSASRHDRSSLPSRVIHPANDTTKAKGSASRGALVSSKGTPRPSTGQHALFAAGILASIIVGALTGGLARLVLLGAGTHSGGGARLHLAGPHLAGLHLVRFHLRIGGGARADIAFARRARSRLRLRRRDRCRPEQ